MKNCLGKTVAKIESGKCGCKPGEYCQCPEDSMTIQFTDGSKLVISIKSYGYDGAGLETEYKEETKCGKSN